MALVRIEVDGREAAVFSPYGEERVEVIRSLPERRWDKAGKCWRIPTDQVPSLMVALQAIGDKVQINEKPQARKTDSGADDARVKALERENQRLRQDLQRMRNEASAKRSSWAEQLFSKLTPEQTERAFKKLSTVVHPDVGGSNELMTDLNVAFDYFGDRSKQ